MAGIESLAVNEQDRRGFPDGSLPEGNAVTTTEAVEADVSPPMAGTPERSVESLADFFRFDLLHDQYGLDGWPE